MATMLNHDAAIMKLGYANYVIPSHKLATLVELVSELVEVEYAYISPMGYVYYQPREISVTIITNQKVYDVAPEESKTDA